MSAVERLGFDPGECVVVVHVDDIGMSRGANAGALLALDGAATCGSIMVPCPAFQEIAEIARERPELDLGIHLTLNAEYEPHRWAPLCDDVPGLVSPDGGMWRTTAEVIEKAGPEEVERELRAQIDRALEAGIDVTHLDSHMGTVIAPKFVDVYARLAREYRLPLFMPRVDRGALRRVGFEAGEKRYLEIVAELEALGFPLFDQFDADSLSFAAGSGREHNARRLDGFGPGLAYLITHCALGDAELEGITGDWRQRDEEHRIYSDDTMRREIEARGIRTIGMRPLRDLLRQQG